MSAVAETKVTTLTYRFFIKADAATIWDAITTNEYVERYGYGGTIEIDLRPGGTYRALATPEMVGYGMPQVMVEGEVVEVEPARRLSYTWDPAFDGEIAAEPATRVTWELEPLKPGVTKVTLTHEIEDAPRTKGVVSGEVAEAGGGWSFILSDLKTLLETGRSLELFPPTE